MVIVEPTGISANNGDGEAIPPEQVFREFYRHTLGPKADMILELSSKSRWGLFSSAYLCMSHLNGALYVAVAQKSPCIVRREDELYFERIARWALFRARLPDSGMIDLSQTDLEWELREHSATEKQIFFIIREIDGAWPSSGHWKQSLKNAFVVNPKIEELMEVLGETS